MHVARKGWQIAVPRSRMPAPRRIGWGRVLDLRLYRVTLLPFLLGLIVVAFSLHPGPAPLPVSQPAQTLDAAGAYGAAPALRADGASPGSAADDALAGRIASTAPPSGFVGSGFSRDVRLVSSSVETAAGRRTVETVIATRAGATPGIALIADRGDGVATAILLQLAATYDSLVTHRQITLVSTAGGAS